MHSRPNSDISLFLEPVEELADSGEDGGGARLAAIGSAKAKWNNANIGRLAVGLGDDKGAAIVAVADALWASFGVHADLGFVNVRAVEVSALLVVNDSDVDEHEFGVEVRGGCKGGKVSFECSRDQQDNFFGVLSSVFF